jgi:hypothetical protein
MMPFHCLRNSCCQCRTGFKPQPAVVLAFFCFQIIAGKPNPGNIETMEPSRKVRAQGGLSPPIVPQPTVPFPSSSFLPRRPLTSPNSLLVPYFSTLLQYLGSPFSLHIFVLSFRPLIHLNCSRTSLLYLSSASLTLIYLALSSLLPFSALGLPRTEVGLVTSDLVFFLFETLPLPGHVSAVASPQRAFDHCLSQGGIFPPIIHHATLPLPSSSFFPRRHLTSPNSVLVP